MSHRLPKRDTWTTASIAAAERRERQRARLQLLKIRSRASVSPEDDRDDFVVEPTRHRHSGDWYM